MSRPSRPLEPDPAQLEAHTRAVTELVLEELRTLETQPSFDLDGVKELRASFREPVPEEGRPIEELLDRVALLGDGLAEGRAQVFDSVEIEGRLSVERAQLLEHELGDGAGVGLELRGIGLEGTGRA